MSLKAYFEILCRSWRVLVICVTTGVILTVAYWAVLPVKWEVQAILVPPQFAGKVLGSPAGLASRLRAPATMKMVCEGLLEARLDADHLRQSVRIAVIGDTVELRVKADSSHLGVKIANLFLKEVNRQEAAYLASLGGQYQDIHSKLLENFQHGNVLLDASSVEFFLYGKETKTTYFVEPNFDPRPVSPGAAVLALLGAVVGLCVGLIKVFFYDTEHTAMTPASHEVY